MDPIGSGRVSIVIPLHNEVGNVAPLVEALAGVLQDGWNVVFVDDGSTDDTLQHLRVFQRQYDWIVVVVLNERVGQAAALKAGFDHSNADLLVTMDGDLQNDPRDIHLIVEKLKEGVEFVIGRRMDRHDRWLDRKLPSWIANRLITWSLRVPFRDIGCGLRGYQRKVVVRLWWWNEFHRYASILAYHGGFSTAQVEVRSHARIHGKAKYGLGRIGRILRDLVVLLSFTHARKRWSVAVNWLLGPAVVLSFAAPTVLAGFGVGHPLMTLAGLLLGTIFTGWLAFRVYCFRYYASALWRARTHVGYLVKEKLG